MSGTLRTASLVDESLQCVVQPLWDCCTPLLIGVRHHSAAVARALPQMLDDFSPKSLLIELPEDLNSWFTYLADSDTHAPVAISAVDGAGHLAFYPLADFSPELVAIRWAFARSIPVIACDLSVSAKSIAQSEMLSNEFTVDRSEESSLNHLDPAPRPDIDRAHAAGILTQMLRRTGSEDSGQLWERLIESPAIVSDAETVRQMALLFGLAVRSSTPNVPIRDLLREAAMREHLRRTPAHSAAIVGSFHANALLPKVVEQTRESDARLLGQLSSSPDSVGVSLIPYSFQQLDERSGYPAGVRDPVWHQRMLIAKNVEQMETAAVEIVVQLCRQLRRRGQVAGTPDATEIIRMMRDLARLRDLPTAGRGELIESIQSCLTQGELFGRAREVARAAEMVLIGKHSGRVTARAPRCGLSVALDELLKSLGLPEREQQNAEPREFRLDVLRLPRDRARAVVLRQLCAAGIPYAKRVDSVEQGQRENLTERWEVSWQQGTAATIESVARYGVTLPQVVEGILRVKSQAHADEQDSDAQPKLWLQQLMVATECSLQHLVHDSLNSIEDGFLKVAGLDELVAAATILGRITAGHVPGLPNSLEDEYPPIVLAFFNPSLNARLASLLRTSLDRLSGLTGSDSPNDVAAVRDLVYWFNGDLQVSLQPETNDSAETQQPPEHEQELQSLVTSGQLRLVSWCRQALDQGSDRMRGAVAGVLCIFEEHSVDNLAALMGGWFDAATDKDSRKQLRYRLAGSAQVLLPQMQSDPIWLSGLEDRLNSADDQEFLNRLPALRGAFSELSPADRHRLLEARLSGYQERASMMLSGTADEQVDTTKLVAARRAADLAGRKAVELLLPDFSFALKSTDEKDNSLAEIHSMHSQVVREKPTVKAISMADRWRMIMGLPPENPNARAGAARCLDQLYGTGRGEGASGKLSNRRSSQGGGTEAPEPTTAEWAEDLEKLFGSDVCQEVLGESARAGNAAALDVLDAERVTPSIELLQQVLSLAGGLSEGRSERLRKLARRITEQLAKRLAVRLHSSMSGLSTPRPTRRRARRLNLPRTIRDNLVNVYRRGDGRAAIIAKRLVFNSTAKRQMDWHLTFVVDVSGSMTESVVYSALCAAIFAELPALTVRFLAFSTEVIDLSGQVSDPLGLLLEVQVGGGTHIGLGLRAARSGIKVPSRSIVVLVSDFEEGVSIGQMLSEVRALTEAGVKCVGLAALDDTGTARFHQGYAKLVASAGMPVAAVSPERLAEWVGDQIRGQAGQAAKLPSGTVV